VIAGGMRRLGHLGPFLLCCELQAQESIEVDCSLTVCSTFREPLHLPGRFRLNTLTVQVHRIVTVLVHGDRSVCLLVARAHIGSLS
jgi:hypothetical protein